VDNIDNKKDRLWRKKTSIRTSPDIPYENCVRRFQCENRDRRYSQTGNWERETTL